MPFPNNRPIAVIPVVLFVGLLASGCGQDASKDAEAAKVPPSVVVAPVVAKDVSEALEYVGRSEASQRVDIRARVSGVLIERPFTEGSEVDANALLFRIDPAEYQAAKDGADAEVARMEAAVEEASRNRERYKELLARDTASVAKFDEAKSKDLQAKAQLAAAKAELEKAKLNLGYTEITSPIAGRSGRANVDVGNLIGTDSGVLVTVLQLDPIDVLFSIGEREYLDYKKASQSGNGPVYGPKIRLANGEMYPHEGKFDLIDNEVDPATGTIEVRVKFANPEHLLLPGQFVNVELTSKTPTKQVVVPQAAVQENQTGPFVLVVGEGNRVEARPIKTGRRVGADIVALEGLSAGETIVVEGIQKVRPGGEVTPTPQKTAAK